MPAENKNEIASTMNKTSRPKRIVTIPPPAAPTASIVPHVDPIRTFAGPSSSSETMFGSAACDAGSKYAEPLEMPVTPRNAKGRGPGGPERGGDQELGGGEAVDDVPRDRGEEEDRQRLEQEHQRRQVCRAGELQDEVE